MPIYEYRCKKCSNEFEIVQKITDEPATECPDCGGKIERLVSATSFSLKGGGWYKDGYSSSGRTTSSNKKDVKKESKKSDK